MKGLGEWITEGVAAMVGGLRMAIAGLVGRVLGTFGLSLVTFNSVLPDLKAFLAGYLDNLPPSLLQFASAVGLDVAMTMVISALTVRMAWKVFIIPTSVRDQMTGGAP